MQYFRENQPTKRLLNIVALKKLSSLGLMSKKIVSGIYTYLQTKMTVAYVLSKIATLQRRPACHRWGLLNNINGTAPPYDRQSHKNRVQGNGLDIPSEN